MNYEKRLSELIVYNKKNGEGIQKRRLYIFRRVIIDIKKETHKS